MPSIVPWGATTVYVVDTNLLVHAANEDFAGHGKALEVLRRSLAGPDRLYLTWGIAYEFLSVCTHKAVFRKPLTFARALEFLRSLFEHPRVTVLVEGADHHDKLLSAVEEVPDLAGSRFHDLHTVLLMREHAIAEIRSADRDFKRFSGTRVVDPLS